MLSAAITDSKPSAAESGSYVTEAMPADLLSQAFEFAQQAHHGQRRKGKPIPFVAHLMAVASLVLEHGGTTEEAAAALLHDTVEDTDVQLPDLERKFGPWIASVVAELSDNLDPDCPNWHERRRRYLDRIASFSNSALLVSASDKLHNVRSVIDALRESREDAFMPFYGGKDGTLWVFREALVSFNAVLATRSGLPSGFLALVEDYRRAVEILNSLSE